VPGGLEEGPGRVSMAWEMAFLSWLVFGGARRVEPSGHRAAPSFSTVTPFGYISRRQAPPRGEGGGLFGAMGRWMVDGKLFAQGTSQAASHRDRHGRDMQGACRVEIARREHRLWRHWGTQPRAPRGWPARKPGPRFLVRRLPSDRGHSPWAFCGARGDVGGDRWQGHAPEG